MEGGYQSWTTRLWDSGNGRLEIAARIIAALVGSLPALLASLATLVLVFRGFSVIPGLEEADYTGPAGFIVGISAFGIFFELFILALRLVNCQINNKIEIIILLAAILTELLMILGYVAAGIVFAYSVKQTNRRVDNLRMSLGWSAGLCFLSAVVYGCSLIIGYNRVEKGIRK